MYGKYNAVSTGTSIIDQDNDSRSVKLAPLCYTSTCEVDPLQRGVSPSLLGLDAGLSPRCTEVRGRPTSLLLALLLPAHVNTAPESGRLI
jgi:hypothetical protein